MEDIYSPYIYCLKVSHIPTIHQRVLSLIPNQLENYSGGKLLEMCLWRFKHREVNKLQGKFGNYKQVNRTSDLNAKHNACFTPCPTFQ